MKQGNASDEDIAFRLRWHVTSVPTYIRDCFQAIGPTLQHAVAGMLLGKSNKG